MPREADPASQNTIAVQKDWAEREFLTSVQLGVAQLSAFLNDFGARSDKENNNDGIVCSRACFYSDRARVIFRVCALTDATTRGRLSALDGKLSRLERRMQVVEATLESVDKSSE